MSGWRLSMKAALPLRLDLRGVTPQAFAALDTAQIERMPIGCGNARVALAEFFSVSAAADDALTFDGDLSRCDRLGWQLAAGRLVVHGSVGHHAGGCMSGGELQIDGDAGLLAGCEMAGGVLRITGNTGDFAAAPLPGGMDGMRGGTLIVGGDAGERFGDRMRRGTALVHGKAGDFLASRMVAGTIAVAGRTGAHVAHGMRRGSVVLLDATGFQPAPTFNPALVDAAVIWQLLARDLARHGGAFAGLAGRRIERHLGDLAVEGKGEIILPQ